MKSILLSMPWAMLLAMLLGAGSLPAQTNQNAAAARAEKGTQLIGRDVRDANDQKIGSLRDIILELRSGRVLYVVVSAGGFVGIGERTIGVPPGVFAVDAARLRLNADKAKLSKAPEYKRSAESQSPEFVSGIYQYFGQNTWWSGAAPVSFDNSAPVTVLFGMKIKTVSGENIGEVNDVAVDLSGGRMVCVIFSPARSLNLANDLYALPPNVLTVSADGKTLSTGIDHDKLAAAPHFPRDQWPEMNWAWASGIYQYYGKQAYFENGELRATGRTNALPRIYHEPEPQR